MIVLVVNFFVKEGKKDEFLTAIESLVVGSQAEAGCIEYNLYADDQVANHFVLVEKWQDQAALDFHNNTDHFINNVDHVGALCDNVTLTRAVPIEK